MKLFFFYFKIEENFYEYLLHFFFLNYNLIQFKNLKEKKKMMHIRSSIISIVILNL